MENDIPTSSPPSLAGRHVKPPARLGLVSRLAVQILAFGHSTNPWRIPLSLGAVAVAFLLRYVLDGTLDNHYMYVTFYPVVITTALLFGGTLGIVAMLGSTVLAIGFFAEKSTVDVIGTAAFLVAGTILSLSIGALREMVRELEQMNAHLIKAKRDLRELANRRSLLLSDLNHRLKNSIHSVVQGLMTEGRELPSEAQMVLWRAAGRLNVLANLHERLYLRDSDASTVDMQEFLPALVSDIWETMRSNMQIISRVHCPDDITLDHPRAVLIGLVVNELLTNAVKYAFVERPQGGHIDVWCVREGAEIVVTVTDDGVGDTYTGEGSGKRLIGSITKQLKGTLAKAVGSEGNSVTLRFPEVSN